MDLHIDAGQLLRDYEALHSMPEPGFAEYKTAEFIRKRLKEEGFDDVRPIAETGTLALLDSGHPGPSYTLRADIDALKFANADGSFEYKHACGHDSHAAMLLSAGIALRRAGIPAKGKLYLLFQPAEETMTGSFAVLKDGLPPLDGIIGIHIRPESELPAGKAAAQLLHGATLPTTVTFTGKGSHGARPFLGRNALSAAALAITMVDAIGPEDLPKGPDGSSAGEGGREGSSWSAKATICDTFGNTHNVVPEKCAVTFDVRAESNVLGRALLGEVLGRCEEAAKRYGCTIESSTVTGYAAEYDPALTAICEEAVREVFGECAAPIKTVGSEDFHAYHMEAGVPAAYMALGSDLKPGLHARDMHFDPACLPAGCELLYRTAERLFE
ncbi:MAG: M20/M25/M40 family metallo-hydrolase [Firmicutes bacterium]|nr:M20/M25/M40 family metallo-hydrolase [Bacillota bacterium]